MTITNITSVGDQLTSILKNRRVSSETVALARLVIAGAWDYSRFQPEVFSTPDGSIHIEHRDAVEHLQMAVTPQQEIDASYYNQITRSGDRKPLTTVQQAHQFLQRVVS